MTAAESRPAPSATLPPHIFSNVFDAHAAGSVTVVLLDLLNTSWDGQYNARTALLEFLEQIGPRDHIGIFALRSRGLTVLHDYATDSASLVTRLKKAKSQIPSDFLASTFNSDIQKEFQDFGLAPLAAANPREAVFFTMNRVVNTLSVFEAIGHHLSAVPGRKSLIWLTDGFPLVVNDGRFIRTFTKEVDAAVRVLNDSGVAVYPVDSRGLVGHTGFDASAGRISRSFMLDFGSMDELAGRTGGRASYNTNALTREIHRAMDDARVTYAIGYYSTDEARDGGFREIRVKVSRPNLDIRYRKGYFALKPDNTPEARDEQVRAAVWSPLESTAIPVNARADFVEEAGADTVSLFVQIDPAAVAFQKEEHRWKAKLDIVYVQKDEEGNVQGESVKDNLTLALAEAEYAEAVQKGLMVERRLPRFPEAITLRIVVRAAASGSIGSLTIPFSQIPAR
jgi:VWFA-related protein